MEAGHGSARHVDHQREPRPADRLAVQVVDNDHVDQRVVRLHELKRVVRLEHASRWLPLVSGCLGTLSAGRNELGSEPVQPGLDRLGAGHLQPDLLPLMSEPAAERLDTWLLEGEVTLRDASGDQLLGSR